MDMKNYFAGFSARYWNRMFHEAYEGRRSYRTAAQVEGRGDRGAGSHYIMSGNEVME